MFISGLISFIVTYLLARAKWGKTLLPADCACMIKVYSMKELIRWQCFLDKLIHQYTAQDIFLARNKVSGHLDLWKEVWWQHSPQERWHGAWPEGQVNTVIQLQARRRSSCVGVAAEPFSSWGVARVMGSWKVSRMHFFLFIGKYKPVGSVCDSWRLTSCWLTLRKYK